MVNNADYFCFSLGDFDGENDIEYENIPKLQGKI